MHRNMVENALIRIMGDEADYALFIIPMQLILIA
jgi:hypothetical protein